jgi:hypothetical protein
MVEAPHAESVICAAAGPPGVAQAPPVCVERRLPAELTQAGLLVMTPHTNDAAEAGYFAAIGVDVIASDDPRIVLGASVSR